MPTTSRIFATLDAVNALIAGLMPAGVTVYDGPQIGYPIGDFVVIGAEEVDVSGEGIMSAIAVATGEQVWGPLGQKSKDETFTIPSVYVAYSGDTTQMSTCRARAATNIGLIETSLRADALIGGVILNPGWADIGITEVNQYQSDTGLAVHVQFMIAVQTRI